MTRRFSALSVCAALSVCVAAPLAYAQDETSRSLDTAYALVHAGNDADALASFEASFARHPATARAYLDAAYAATRLGKHDAQYDRKALVFFEAAFAQRPGTADEYLDAAYTARRFSTIDGSYARKAIEFFDASFAQQPGTAVQYLDAAYAARSLGDSDRANDRRALELFDASFALQPGTAQQYADAAYAARDLAVDDPTYARKALELFEASFAKETGTASQYVDAAYTALSLGKHDRALERKALALFRTGFARQPATATQYADAAYLARGLNENEIADDLFRRSLDANARAGQYDAERAFGYRRAIDDAERRVGVVVNGAYQSGGFGPQETIGLFQGGTEIYWQPSKIGYRDGKIFQLFARQYTTLYDRSGGATGLPTLQWSMGARYKPFPSRDLVFTVEKLIKGGRTAYDDTLFRIGYSLDEGIDLHPIKPDWPSWQIYTESAYFANQGRFIQPVELRYGHAWRLDSIGGRLVVFPHAAVAGDFDSRAPHRLALGVGPGVGLRYWFRESAYRAPASWFDLNVQYRLRLTDANRAKGLVVRTTLWF
ncbi:bacteriophage N4 adsorption protein A [Trinickia sp. NRRL B-1857]|uniref:NfrA family protein n=1 Tax=Trinickia sp. NRRL B-1857 TaxID=3162879 RepID=UPI003D2CA278